MNKKYAWRMSDIAGELGIAAVGDVGIAGLLGAIGVGSAGATGVAGVSAGIAGILSGPVGWVFAVAGIAGSIYFATRQTDDNVEDLMSRIEALDYKNTLANDAVEYWLAELEKYRKSMQVPLTATDQRQRAVQLANRVSELVTLKNFMDAMSRDWPQIKAALKDWGADPSDFEYSFKRTYAALVKQISKINQESKSAAHEILAKNPEMIDPLMTEVLSLISQIKSVWATPEFSSEELALIEVGKKIMAKKDVSVVEIEESIPKLNVLREELRALLVEAKRRAGKRANRDNDIKKMSVKLPDKPEVPGGATKAAPPADPMAPSARRVGVKNPIVESLQEYVNHVSVSTDINNAFLAPDGIYGPKTAKALSTIISASPTLQASFKQFGITPQMTMDVDLMNKYEKFIRISEDVLRRISKYIMSGQAEKPEGAATPTTAPEPTKPATCNINKPNPTPEETLVCLKNNFGYVGGLRVVLYEYMKRFMNDAEIVKFIKHLFGESAPKRWSSEAIIGALEAQHG